MITRVKIDGFKNLVDMELHFGPFTCIAGQNGVGKSNIFDAILFLSATAGERTLLEAAQSVRGEENRDKDVAGLFHKNQTGANQLMRFDVDMIVPKTAVDHLGQEAVAGRTFLNYQLVIAYVPSTDATSTGLRIVSEDLTYIPQGETAKRLSFSHSKAWRESVIIGERRTPYISTMEGRIRLHQDKGTAGRAWQYPAESLPRTVLSSVTAQESPTALVAREEMRSWGSLQLEPSKLRAPDGFQSPTSIGVNGAHLASTLHHLATHLPMTGIWEDSEAVYCELANRLAELIGDVTEVYVERDEKRELYTLFAAGKDGIAHSARSLSDGTLRFLALAVMLLDPRSVKVLCLEEPENGIHPERINSMVSLLEDMAADCESEADETNPLRQVIINTHSPTVVAESQDDSIVFLEQRTKIIDGRRFKTVEIVPVDKTWRAKMSGMRRTLSKGDIGRFLSPVRLSDDNGATIGAPEPAVRRRIKDRCDIRQTAFGFYSGETRH